jgi:hypothetical protein
MDVETPTKGRDRSEVCTGERGGRSTRDSPTSLVPGGSFPSHYDVGLGRPMTSPMISPSVLDTLGGSCVPSGTCGMIQRPNVFLLEANVALKRHNVTLKGHDVTFSA